MRRTRTASTFRNSYKEKNCEEARRKIVKIAAERFPGSVAIIVQSDGRTPSPKKVKYLTSKDNTIGQFVAGLNEYLPGTASKASRRWCSGDGYSLCMSELISDVYRKHVDADGLLYVYYTEENTMG